MNLVDELKAALPGWTVTGDAINAVATMERANVSIEVDACIPNWLVAWATRASMVVCRATGETVPDVVNQLRSALHRNLVLMADTMTHTQAALNALGGGK